MGKEKGNIILIGMPASGKSTVGVILAKILGMDFMDTDILIQQSEGARLNEIIEKHGIDAFLDVEQNVLLEINVSDTVIATGGSAVYSEKAMKHLAKGGSIVYLKVELEELKRRLKDIRQRGVVLRAGESLEKMFEIRSALYEEYADITILEDGASIEDTVRAVTDGLNAGM
ncbi:MAG: shikimate kinase [Lachnospiraceae bacterium]|nr:shikimate kinase [Lachnospiraceae bacterium]